MRRRGIGKPFARASRPAKVDGIMNGTERAYETDFLIPARARGDVVCWWYEKITLKLASDTRYTVDFFVLLASGEMEAVEIKGGFIRDDSKVKLKLAADQFPFRFKLAQRLPKKLGGGWKVTGVASDTWQEAA